MGLKELEEKAVVWILSLAVKKAIPKVAIAVTALLTAKYLPYLQKFGVSLDANAFQVAFIGVLVGLFDMFRNWIKVKTGIQEL